MPIPFIIGAIAVGAGIFGVSKGVEASKDYNRASELNESAARKARIAGRMIEDAKENTKNAIEALGKEKIEILSSSMNDFVVNFEKIKNVNFKESRGIEELKKFNLTPEKFQEIKTASCEAKDIAVNGLAAMGSGAATACLTYGAVGYLGAASTGTAIGALSGVAASNATLAWLGGGSIASGGFGMAGGMVVLGGLIAGPALAVGGFLMASQAREALNDAENNYDKAKAFKAQAETIETALGGISKRAEQLRLLLTKINVHFEVYISKLIKIIKNKGTDWKSYGKDEQGDIFKSVQLAQTLKIIIDAPLLDQEGGLNEKSAETLISGERYLKAIESVI